MIRIKKVEGFFIDRKYEKPETFLKYEKRETFLR